MFTMEQKSIFKESVWKVFEIFVDQPLKIHFIKQISRKINLAPTSVKLHLEKLEGGNIIVKEKGDRFFGYIANRDNEDFLFYKKIFNLIKIKESGLTDFIIKSAHPNAIVLYGSYLRGEDIEKSDIDLLIISKTRRVLELGKFERILKRKIHLISEDSVNKLNKYLKADILNGLTLNGYIK